MDFKGLIKPDIVTEVSKYLTLRAAGKYLRGLCPFHAERTPSFFVKPYTQRFHCYGCGADGDVVEFVMKAENLDFKAACQHLGIELKPTKKTWREIKKKEAVKEFKEWCYNRHDDLCRLYRTLQQAKSQARTEAEVGAISDYYHIESLWLHEMEILESGDNEAKLALYRQGANK